MNDQSDLEILKKSLLFTLKNILDVCKKNNIHPFLICGSLLGAIRHQGFIPWDDDLDIGMTREDYNKFLALAPIMLPPIFSVCNASSESLCGISFSKIRIKGTFFPEKNNPDLAEQGIFVDIFPYDKAPKSRLNIYFQYFFSKIFILSLLKKCKYTVSCNKVFHLISFFICYFMSKNKIYDKLIKWQTRYNNCSSFDNYVTFCGIYKPDRELIPKECIDNGLLETSFENISVPIPKNPQIILEITYGDYMKLPPLENRKHHFDGKINFGDITNYL